jgi:hypothetical protein
VVPDWFHGFVEGVTYEPTGLMLKNVLTGEREIGAVLEPEKEHSTK